MTTYIGNNCQITGTRVFLLNQGKTTLLSWSIPRCKLCQKFLKKRNGGKNICHNCFIKGRKEYQKEYHKNHPKDRKAYSYKYYQEHKNKCNAYRRKYYRDHKNKGTATVSHI